MATYQATSMPFNPLSMSQVGGQQAPALDNTYGNQLKGLLSNPSSFQMDPGYQFAMNQGLDAVNRQNAANRGSGNALAALTNYASGLASQQYNNRVGQLSQLSGQEEQYNLGQGQNVNAANRNAADFYLGQQGNANQAQGIANQYALGQGSLANQQQEIANQYALGQGGLANQSRQIGNEYTLGQGGLANQAQGLENQFGLGLMQNQTMGNFYNGMNQNNAFRNWSDYQLGLGGLANNSAANQNQFNLGMYNAQTNRAGEQNLANYRNSQGGLDWTKFYTNLYPVQRSPFGG